MMTSLLRIITRQNVDNDRILMLGLNDTGKTTLLYKLILDEIVSPVTTIGFNVETLRLGPHFRPMEIWDLAGQPVCRRLWVHYLESPGVHGLIFVVDGSQATKPEEVDEFQNVLLPFHLREAPMLLLVNKIDLPSCRSLTEIAESLQLHSMGDRLWHIQGCSAITGEGLKEGLNELSRMVKCYRNGNQRQPTWLNDREILNNITI